MFSLLFSEPTSYKWAAWGRWSDCSGKCGGDGTIARTRACIPPQHGGEACPSQNDVQTKNCKNKCSPGKHI